MKWKPTTRSATEPVAPKMTKPINAPTTRPAINWSDHASHWHLASLGFAGVHGETRVRDEGRIGLESPQGDPEAFAERRRCQGKVSGSGTVSARPVFGSQRGRREFTLWSGGVFSRCLQRLETALEVPRGQAVSRRRRVSTQRGQERRTTGDKAPYRAGDKG